MPSILPASWQTDCFFSVSYPGKENGRLKQTNLAVNAEIDRYEKLAVEALDYKRQQPDQCGTRNAIRAFNFTVNFGSPKTSGFEK